MTVYTVAGHPLGPSPIPGPDAEGLRVQLIEHGVGTTLTMTLQAGDDTKIKAHGALK